MKANVGSADRLVRVVLGLLVLSYVFIGAEPMRWWGLAGLVPLLTAAMSYCPLYSILGMNTCGVKQ